MHLTASQIATMLVVMILTSKGATGVAGSGFVVLVATLKGSRFFPGAERRGHSDSVVLASSCFDPFVLFLKPTIRSTLCCHFLFNFDDGIVVGWSSPTSSVALTALSTSVTHTISPHARRAITMDVVQGTRRLAGLLTWSTLRRTRL